MNILKKQLAPLSDKAWEEIKEQSTELFKIYLTARNFVDIDGPNGIEQAGVSTGRLKMPEHPVENNVNYALREVKPLIEIRKPFELDLWEMDNIDRGAKDADLEPLENAARQVAQFEENLIYKGFREGNVQGLDACSVYPKVKLPNDLNAFLKIIGAQLVQFNKNGVEGPFSLVINENKWQEMVSLANGYPLLKQLEEVMGLNVIINYGDFNSYLVSKRGGDFELSIGMDHTIGYQGHDNKKLRLYYTQSFTFRVIGPEAVIILEHTR